MVVVPHRRHLRRRDGLPIARRTCLRSSVGKGSILIKCRSPVQARRRHSAHLRFPRRALWHVGVSGGMCVVSRVGRRVRRPAFVAVAPPLFSMLCRFFCLAGVVPAAHLPVGGFGGLIPPVGTLRRVSECSSGRRMGVVSCLARSSVLFRSGRLLFRVSGVGDGLFCLGVSHPIIVLYWNRPQKQKEKK